MEIFHKRFRLARKAARYTSEQTSELLGVSRSYISAIENGKRQNVSPEFLVGASNLFKVSIEYLLGIIDSRTTETLIQLYITGWMTEECSVAIKKAIDDELVRLDLVELNHHRMALLDLASSESMPTRVPKENLFANKPLVHD